MPFFLISLGLLLSTGCSDMAPLKSIIKPPPDSTAWVDSASLSGPSLPAPSGVEGHWQLIFSDEFNKNGLDSARWHPSYPWGGTKGAELQEYVPSGVSVARGILRLTATRSPQNTLRRYESGMIATWGRFNVTRASVIEARVHAAPEGPGLWPAIWLHASSGGWPPELDVLEVLGTDTKTWLMSAHWAVDGVHQSIGFRKRSGRLASGWHTITMQWDSSAVIWFIDGRREGIITDPIQIPNEPMYLILNLAIGGGGWPGTPDETTVFPASLEVDYVRIWRRVK